MSSRYDIVVYGATGFTGTYVVRMLASVSLFKGKTIAVSGRSEKKLRGNENVRKFPIIVADSSKEESLANMARQAKVIINTVGPYILYGEAVVRAAINNNTSHVDISGDPAFLERMEHKYGKMARDKGVYIVGACGYDSIPCDLGIEFLKRHFDGTLAYAETCWRMNKGTAGYTLNTGTFESLLMGIKSIRDGGEAELHRSVVPDPVPRSKYTPSWRFPLTRFREPSFGAWAMPFPGVDKAIVERSQYYDFHVNGRRTFPIYPYFSIGSFFKSLLFALWLGIVGFFGLFAPTRRFMAAHPEGLSFGMFKKAGPTLEQIRETSFDYFFFGSGWEQGETPDGDRPTRKVTAVCHGPDPGYMCTSACISSAALALLDGREKLPVNGGVFTTASAFRDTHIFEYLKTMGVTFEILHKGERSANPLI